MITNYINQEATLYRAESFDEFGKPIVQKEQVIGIRFLEKSKYIRRTDGAEYKIDGVAWVAGNITLEIEDVLVYEGVNYKITSIYAPRNFYGQVNHKKLELVRTKE